LPGRNVLLVGDDTDKNLHGKKFSIRVCATPDLLEFLSKNVLELRPTAARTSSPSHRVHVVYSLVGRNQSPSEFPMHSEMFHGVDTFADTHNSNPTISIAETVYEMLVCVFNMCKCVRHINYDGAETQHSH
jgi:hypothetical protein